MKKGENEEYDLLKQELFQIELELGFSKIRNDFEKQMELKNRYKEVKKKISHLLLVEGQARLNNLKEEKQTGRVK